MSQCVQITVTPEQAQAIADALDVYVRLCLGQLDEVQNLVWQGVIPRCSRNMAEDRSLADDATNETVLKLMIDAKRALGYASNASHGIGHPHVALSGRRSYEVYKVISQTLAMARNPNPEFRTVDYDGLGPRYTEDPAPLAAVINGGLTDG